MKTDDLLQARSGENIIFIFFVEFSWGESFTKSTIK